MTDARIRELLDCDGFALDPRSYLHRPRSYLHRGEARELLEELARFRGIEIPQPQPSPVEQQMRVELDMAKETIARLDKTISDLRQKLRAINGIVNRTDA